MFTEVADGVLVWRQPVLDVNAVLVLGGTGALVVDTLSTPEQAGELATAVRAVTPLPWRVLNTHVHFDHCFGNAVLGAGTEVWGHPGCRPDASTLAAAIAGFPALAAGLRAVTVRAPDRAVAGRTEFDLGGRTVTAWHPGRGHTDHDVVALVPDAAVLIAGDLVEEGAPPSLDDAYPLEWPATLAALLPAMTGAVVPGHGAVVDRAFVVAQHAALAGFEWACREGHADGAPADEVAARFPYGVAAVRRTYAQLDGAG